jgi:hypothetical protein
MVQFRVVAFNLTRLAGFAAAERIESLIREE